MALPKWPVFVVEHWPCHPMFVHVSSYVWSHVTLCLVTCQPMFDHVSSYVWSRVNLCLITWSTGRGAGVGLEIKHRVTRHQT